MKTNLLSFCKAFFTGLLMFLSVFGSGQTNPAAQGLPYTQDFSSFTGSTTTYPAGWQGWDVAGSLSTAYVTTAPSADRVLTSGTNTLTSRGVWDITGKLGISSTNSAISTASLAIKTTNLTSINVSFKAGTQRTENTRLNELGLQYRIGTSGVFTNVTGATYQNQLSPTNTTGTGAVNIQTISVTLPTNADNQAVVQLRWISKQVSGTGNNPTFSIDDINITAVATGAYSITDGDWNVGSTWNTGVVPASADNVTISTGNTVYTSTALTRTGTTTVNGNFQLNNGGWASGTAFTYAATGSGLIFNSGGLYGIGSGQAFWPTSSPPFNVTVNSGSGAQTNVPVGAVAGTLTLNGQLDAVNAVTVNGTLQLNAGGYVSSNAPVYGNASTLLYNTTYGVGTEWTGNAATAGSGVPNNVTIQNSAVVTTPAGSARGMAGSLNIISGNLSLGNDLSLAGNWTNTGTFTPNNKAVFFNGSGAQSITNASGETFSYLIHNGAGALTFNNNVTVSGNSGDVLQLLAGTINLNGKTLTLSGSGGNVKLSGAQILNSSVAGALFNVTGTAGTKYIYGGTLSVPANVTTVLNNGIDFGSNVTTIAGILRIAAGGFVSNNPPIYTNTSTLEYNGVSPYGVGSEWTAGGGATTTVGAGVPNIVSLVNSTVNMPNSDRGVVFRLTIGAGSVLNMNTVSGDLYDSGLWVDNGTFNHNNRAVFFNGTGTQSISNASGAETFAYLINIKSAGSLQLYNDVNIVGTGTGALTLRGATNLDLQTANLNINGTGSILVDGGIRTITAAIATGKLNINAATSVVSANSGSLYITSNVITTLNNSINFGANLTTINGKLIVKPNGTATSSPIYSGSSTILEYNATGSTGTPHQVAQEWSGNIAGTTNHTFATGAGIPQTVNLVGSVIHLYSGEISTSALNIDAASTLNLNNVANYNDLKLFGNLVNNGTIVANNRTVIFQGAANQNITGVDTAFGNIKINNNVSVTTSVNLTLSNTLDLVLGKLIIGTKNVTANATSTPDNYASSYVVTASTGQLKLPVASTAVIFPIGFSTTKYNPITVTNSGTADTYGFNVKTGVADATDLTYMVNNSWVVTEGIAGGGSLKVIPQWNTASDQGASFGSADAFLQLYTTPSLVSEYPATIAGTTVSTATLTNAGDYFTNTLPLSASTTYFAVGKHKSQEIDVTGNSVSIASGDTTPSTSDDTDFGNIVIDNTVTKTYTIKNLGQVNLRIDGISISGSSEFAITSPTTLPSVATPVNLAANGTLTFSVTFTPTTEGTKNATISIANNDSDENPYTFAITGKATKCALSAETIIANQDFEGTNPLTAFTKWNAALNPSTGGTGGTQFYLGNISAYGSSKTTTENTSLDTKALLTINRGAGASITFDPVNTSAFSNTVLSFRLGAFSSGTTNGLDASDVITVSVKAGSSASFKTIMTITGNNNSIWGYSATGIASASYNVATPLNFVPADTGATGAQIINDGFSTIRITDIPNVSGLEVRISTINNATAEIWAIDNVKLVAESQPSVKTWSAGAWSPAGIPTSGDAVIIASNYDTATNGKFTSCECQVNSGATLTVSPSTDTVDNSVTVKYGLTNNGNVVVESDGNLSQIKDVDNVGAISVRRAHTLTTARKEYNFLSSPVANQNMKLIFGNNPANIPFVTKLNEPTNAFINAVTADWAVLGKGFSVKEPRSAGYVDMGDGLPDTMAQYKGIPNNGDITLPLSYTTGRGYNLAGNPYPSNIDIMDLYANSVNDINSPTPNIDPTFRFWDNTVNDIYTQMGGAYQGYSFALFNAKNDVTGFGIAAPGNGTGGPVGSKVPNRVVKVSQAFMVRARAAGAELKFKNGQRKTTNTGTEFYGKSSTQNRYRLQLVKSDGFTVQNGVSYFDAGNQAFGLEDTRIPNAEASDALFTFAGDAKVVINGKNAFTTEDVVTLGLRHFASGTYKIQAVDEEGVFANGQIIYLKDKQLGILTNLTAGDYTFTSESGEFTNRFEIVYKEGLVLATDNTNKAKIEVFRDASDFVVRSSDKSIERVELYDASGRLVLTMDGNSKEVRFNSSKLVEGMYILKAELKVGEQFTKKIRK